MSECIGNIDEQKKCRFYEQATIRNRCMYRVFDSFCTCIDAQIDADKSLEEKNQEAIDELRDSEVGKSF
jgi:hypothetical protein